MCLLQEELSASTHLLQFQLSTIDLTSPGLLVQAHSRLDSVASNGGSDGDEGLQRLDVSPELTRPLRVGRGSLCPLLPLYRLLCRWLLGKTSL